jgi:hypothetical protein
MEIDGPNMKSRRGFASLTPERRREVATLGGKAAHAKGTAHEFTPAEAQIAGHKGGTSRAEETKMKPLPEEAIKALENAEKELGTDKLTDLLRLIGRRGVINQWRGAKEEAQNRANADIERVLKLQREQQARLTGHVCKRCGQVIPDGMPFLQSMGEYFHQGECPPKP